MMASEYLFIAARKHFREEGVWAISVASVPGLSAEEIARRSPFIRGSQIRATNAGALRKGGYEVEPDGPPMRWCICLVLHKERTIRCGMICVLSSQISSLIRIVRKGSNDDKRIVAYL